MKALRWALWAQVLFFTAWGGSLLLSHQGAAEVFLATQPVDPRDLLSGHYVSLAYPLARPEAQLCPDFSSSGSVYLRLQPSGEKLRAGGGEIELWTAADCSVLPPTASPDQVWARGRVDRSRGSPELRFGIERFYVSEGSPLRTVRSGDVAAKVAVGRNGDMRIRDLVRLER